MKKLGVLLMLSMVLSLGLMSCGGDDGNGNGGDSYPKWPAEFTYYSNNEEGNIWRDQDLRTIGFKNNDNSRAVVNCSHSTPQGMFGLESIDGKTITVKGWDGYSLTGESRILCTNWTLENEKLILSGGDPTFEGYQNIELFKMF